MLREKYSPIYYSDLKLIVKLLFGFCVALVFVWLLSFLTLIVPPIFSGWLPKEKTVLNFPTDVSLGELWLIENTNCFTCGTGRQRVGDARGVQTITVPGHGWYIELQMSESASVLLPYLSQDESMNKLGSLILQGSDVTDADLQHLTGIPLLNVDLRETGINGSGLRYLQPNDEWSSIDLRYCQNLNVDTLSHFQSWSSATITVTDGEFHGFDEHDRPVIHGALYKKARQAICGDRPETECAQVR